MSAALDLDRAPVTIAWEVTRACAYRCLHCRADAQPRRDPRELSTEEGMRMLRELAAFGTDPILVLTGGDPLMRRDVFELARFADRRGFRVALTPTATALTTRERMCEARESGVRTVAFSVDAAEPSVHDRFRGFEGSFARTLRGMEAAAAEGLPLQVNTTACRLNVGELERMLPLLEDWNVVRWAVFFLVPVGRGSALPMLSAHEQERVLRWLHDVSRGARFAVKTTAAPQYRRIAARSTASLEPPARGVNDGRGFMFVSHRGEVMPSGFLPLAAGNVHDRSPAEIYRRSALFRRLRDPDALKGKCGRCEFRELCGGSRARSYALTGDPLASDPSCPYEPR